MINNIALLPEAGSNNFAVMLSIVEDFPDYQFVIAGAPSQESFFMKVYNQQEY
jgi:lipid-A-disaccharide synthase